MTYLSNKKLDLWLGSLAGGGAPRDIIFDFANQAYTNNGSSVSLASLATLTGNSGTAGTARNAHDSTGIYTQFATDVPRITNNGLAISQTRTNRCVRSRGLGGTSWTVTTVSGSAATITQNATGIFNDANGGTNVSVPASSVTTITQNITDATSRARTISGFASTVSGSGTVEVTLNNFSNAATITPGSGALKWGPQWWQSNSVANLSNPVVGYRITAGAGGAFVNNFDNFQCEDTASGYATEPIIVPAGTAQTRGLENAVFVTPAQLSILHGTAYWEVRDLFNMSNTFKEIFQFNAAASEKLGAEISDVSTGPNVMQSFSFHNNAFECKLASSGSVSTLTTYRGAFSWEYANFNAAYTAALQVGLLSQASGVTPGGTFNIYIGCNNGAQTVEGYIAYLRIKNTVDPTSSLLSWVGQ